MRALRRVARYLRHDFPEIVFPSSLPDPPDYKPPRRLSWREWFQGVRLGTADYFATWRQAPPTEEAGQQAPAQPTMMEELAATARSSRSLRPVLGRVYQTQVAALQQAATAFIAGYREGVAERPDLSAIFPRAQPQAAAGSSSEAAAAPPERARPQEAAEAAGRAEPGSSTQPAAGGVDAPALRAMLARSAPPPGQPGAPADAVSRALSEAEALAAGVLSGGGGGASQRAALEAAIARAEAAMAAAQGLSESDTRRAQGSERSDKE